MSRSGRKIVFSRAVLGKTGNRAGRRNRVDPIPLGKEWGGVPVAVDNGPPILLHGGGGSVWHGYSPFPGP